MSDTSGFYRFDKEAATLLYAPNFVYAPTFTLRRGMRDSKLPPIAKARVVDVAKKVPVTYPVDGWYWFDGEAEARAFFGLPPALVEE